MKFSAALLAALSLTFSTGVAFADVGDSAGDPVNRTPREVVRAAVQPPKPFQNRLWWFGAPNPNPPAPLYTRTFLPLANLPGWTSSYSGWFRNIRFEACVGGLSNVVGPYGTSTTSISRGC